VKSSTLSPKSECFYRVPWSIFFTFTEGDVYTLSPRALSRIAYVGRGSKKSISIGSSSSASADHKGAHVHNVSFFVAPWIFCHVLLAYWAWIDYVVLELLLFAGMWSIYSLMRRGCPRHPSARRYRSRVLWRSTLARRLSHLVLEKQTKCIPLYVCQDQVSNT
jgi:hypothetical protein